MKINKRLLEKLKRGEIAIDYIIKSDEELKKLNDIIHTVLPHSSTVFGKSRYYSIHNSIWKATSNHDKLSVRIKDFFIYTLEDLTNGVVALEYGGNYLEDLTGVLRHCFYKDSFEPDGGYTYYYCDKENVNVWSANDSTNLPTQKLSVFMEEFNRLNKKVELVEGKEYLVWDNEEESITKTKFHHTYNGVHYFRGITSSIFNTWDNYKEIVTKHIIELEVKAESKEDAINKVENSLILWGDEIKLK